MSRTKEFQSQSIPGASFVLLRVGKEARNRTELELCELRHKQRLNLQEQLGILPSVLSADMEKITEAIKELPTEDAARLDYLAGTRALLEESVHIQIAKSLLQSFQLPGEEYADVKGKDDLFEFGPENFVQEIMDTAAPMWGLLPAEEKNSEQPSISHSQGDGLTNDSTVIPANREGTTSLETAS